MIPIKKYAEPRGLKAAKKNFPNLTYDQFSTEKEFAHAFHELRSSLLAEQGYLCCYCQKKVPHVKDEITDKVLMKSEHFIPKKGKEKDLSKQLDYENLLGACLGNQDSDTKNHCDSSKSEYRLKVLPNPTTVLQPHFNAYLTYKVKEKEGEVVVMAADITNQELIDDIDKRLNLNEQNLKIQRFSVWKAIWRQINKNNKLDIVLLNEVLNKYQFTSSKQERDFKAFCGFIVYWYEKRYKNELLKVR